MIRRLRATVLAAFAALALCSAPARAELSVTADASAVSFGELRAADLHLGFVERHPASMAYALRISVSDTDTVNWTLSMRAESDYFTAAGGDAKPCGDLLWRADGAGAYEPVSILDQDIATGTGDAVIDYDLLLKTGWLDAPGAYGLTLVFTITEN